MWQRVGSLGRDASSLDRALLLASFDGDESDVLSGEPLGRCHARLLRLHLRMLGGELWCVANCPDCGSRVEFSVDSGAFLDLAVSEHGRDDLVLTHPGFTIRCRPPAPTDLMALADEPDPAAALWRRCAVATDTDGHKVDLSLLPASVLDEIEEALASADPLAELIVKITCPECRISFDADVDLGSFLWSEVDALAKRILHEVDILARAYGWTEPDVFALSDSRRAAYLRLVLEGAP